MAADSFVISAAIRYLTVFIKALPLIDIRPILKCLTTLTYRGDKTRSKYKTHKKIPRYKNHLKYLFNIYSVKKIREEKYEPKGLSHICKGQVFIS